MAPVPPSNSVPAKAASTSPANKKARLISKDLDRSPLRVTPKSTQVQTKLKPRTHRRNATKFQSKPRGGYGKKFKRAPSNYEANMWVTHSLVRPLAQEPLVLQPASVLRQVLNNKVPTTVKESTSETKRIALQRAVTQQYQPRKPGSTCYLRAQRARYLRLLAAYPQARALLTRVSRARAGTRLPFYAVHAVHPYR